MKSLLTALIFSLVVSVSNAATYTISASGTTFTPSNYNIHIGDVIHWTFTGTHDVVSGTNCTSDGKFTSGTKNDGESYDFTFNTAGTFPFYCSFHCSMGMVGSIFVSGTSGIETSPLLENFYKVFPNPFSDNTNLSYELKNNAKVTIDVLNVTGQNVLKLESFEAPGHYYKVLELSKMANGVYILHLSLDGVPSKEAVLVKE